MRTLTTAEAKAFYDRFGRKQDTQAWYEDPAVDALIGPADLTHAHAVFELGCGTGRLAQRLLATVLREDCRYVGVDISDEMIRLAGERLRPWRNRAEVAPSDGTIPPGYRDAAYDRFVTTYVFDLLPDDAIVARLADAHRLLAPEGRLCAVSLTHGRSATTQLVSATWSLAHRLSPSLVGGCRPIVLRDLLPPDRWRVSHHDVVTAWGISSEVLVAIPLP